MNEFFCIFFGLIFVIINFLFLLLVYNDYYKIITSKTEDLKVCKKIIEISKLMKCNKGTKNEDYKAIKTRSKRILSCWRYFEEYTFTLYLLSLYVILIFFLMNSVVRNILYVTALVILIFFNKKNDGLRFYIKRDFAFAFFLYSVFIGIGIKLIFECMMLPELLFDSFLNYCFYLIYVVIIYYIIYQLISFIKSVLKIIDKIFNMFFEFENKLKFKSIKIISVISLLAINNAFELCVIKYMGSDSFLVKVIFWLLMVTSILFSLDVLPRIFLMIKIRKSICQNYSVLTDMTLKLILYVFVYVIILSTSVSYTISIYNPNSFSNTSKDFHKYIELNKKIVNSLKYDIKSENYILDELDNNVTIIIEVDSDGKLILDKNVIGKIIKAEKPLGICDSLYYTCISLFTIGYGDITPVSWYAKVESIIMSITSVMLLVVFINLFLNISVEDKTNFISRRNSNYNKNKQIK